MEWKKVKLGDCCDITSSKRFHLSERTHTGVPFYCTKEIIQKLRGDKKIDCDYIPEDLYLDIKKKFGVPTKDDLLLTTRGTIGIPYLYKDTDRFYFADGNLSWFRKFNDYLNPNYLYYWFLSPNGRFCVNSIAVGTAQKAVPIAGLMNLPISLPPLPYQRRISSILSDYDSLIENYQRQISLLEESAKRIYKEWFVDFKFPGVEMAENGLPKGWQKKKLGEICETTSGGTPSRSNDNYYRNGDFLWIKTQELNDGFVFDTEEKITKEAIEKSSAKLLPANSLVLAMYGATIGKLAFVVNDFTCNQACCVFIYNNNQHILNYLWLWLRLNRTFLISQGNGAAQPNLSQAMIKSFDIFFPNIELLYSFNDVVNPIFDQIKSLTSQIRLLRQNRDILLPRLMNGEIEVEG